jgi:hypothetical protein
MGRRIAFGFMRSGQRRDAYRRCGLRSDSILTIAPVIRRRRRGRASEAKASEDMALIAAQAS